MRDGHGHHATPWLIADLQARLNRVARRETQDWFENYLKHAIRYRGVRSPDVACIVRSWRHDHDLQQLPAEEDLALAATLIRQDHAEDKFAGIYCLQKLLQRRVGVEALLETAEALFASGAFFDWSTTDWFCVRVLGPTLSQHGDAAAERIAGWSGNANMWNRRASIVPFRSVVKDPSFHPRIEATITALVGDQARFIQTGIGWVISDLSKSHPQVAEKLIERHFDDLAAEVIRRHTRHLPNHETYKARKRGGACHGHAGRVAGSRAGKWRSGNCRQGSQNSS